MTCPLSKKGHFYNDSGICACGVNCGDALAAAFKWAHTRPDDDPSPEMASDTFWLVRDPLYPKDLPHIVIACTQNEALVASALLWNYEGESRTDYLQDALAVPLTSDQVETLKLKEGTDT